MIQNKYKQKEVLDKAIIFFIGAIMASFLLYYVSISTDCLPLMDYWKGCSAHLEQIVDGGFSWSYIFPIPHKLHWNPFYSICDYIFVRVFKCDNRAYI